MPMSTDPKRAEQKGPQPPVPDDALHKALNRLEGMLEQQHVVPDKAPDTESKIFDEAINEPEPLPLLEEVVIPGDLLSAESPEDTSPQNPPPVDAVPVYTDLLSRLASELDIIIESCVDEALAQAKQNLLVKIKNHLDIVLPEILDEMARRQSDGKQS